MKSLPSLALLLALPAAAVLPAHTVQDDSDLVARITARAERAMKDDALEGMVVVVAVGDEVLVERGWGRLPGGGLAEPASSFRAGPLVEPLAAVAALSLVEEGKLELDAPVGKVLEGLEWEGTEVTLHHLLSQTSGLIGWTAAHEARGGDEADVAGLVGLVKELGVQSAPGECFEYSESNGLLIGALVEKAAGKPLADVIAERVLAKAGVENSGFDVDDAPPAQEEAECSTEIAGEQIDVEHGVHVFGQDDFCASALDLLRIRSALSAREILGDDSIEAMREAKRLNDGTEIGFGYGMSVAALGGFQGVTTGGSSDGTTVHFAFYPEPEVSVIVLVAAERAPLTSLERDLSRLVLDLPLPGVQDMALEPEESAAYVGRYQVGCTTYVCAMADDGRLTISVADRPTYRLLFQGRRTFVAQRDAEVRFTFVVEDGDDQAAKVIIDERGRISEAVRFQ